MTPAEQAVRLRALPPVGVTFTLEAVIEMLEGLDGSSDNLPAIADRDLTAGEFGRVFKRSASTARLWCERGLIPGAFKLQGREWRIPTVAVAAFRQTQTPTPAREKLAATGGQLGDWRRPR